MTTKRGKCLPCCILVFIVFELISANSSDFGHDDDLKVSAATDRSKRQVTLSVGECQPTETIVRGGEACGGQTIFEDDFSTMKEDLWQIEQFIPVSSHLENPFVSYQKSDAVVYVADGYLHIAPKLQERMPGFTKESISLGNLDLFSGCTSRGEECYQQVSGADILKPVVSGRVKSFRFAFTYGTVHIRAKLPQGDWLYPELLLEPLFKKYGNSNYASGVMKIASARGNTELRVGLVEYGNEVLYGGPIMNLKCREQLISTKTLNEGQWGDEFHNYSLTWTPDYISLSVDGEQWGLVQDPDGLLHSVLSKASSITHDPYSYCSGLPLSRLFKATKMAPFDVDFVISLSVAAGGITEFPDESYSGGGRPKPWRNSARKGMLAFWEDLPVWEKTWTQPELLIDHIKVVAL